MDVISLSPCRFCGSKPEFYESFSEQFIFPNIICRTCDHQVGGSGYHKLLLDNLNGKDEDLIKLSDKVIQQGKTNAENLWIARNEKNNPFVEVKNDN